MSDWNPKSITPEELNNCVAINGRSVRLLLSKMKHRYDREKIVPEYNELIVGGIWHGYYGERPLTEVEYKRREKYYTSNCEVFNEELDKAQQINPNFINNRYDDYICTRDTIIYGDPQSTVRKRMRLLFGDKVLTALMEEDPLDRQ